MNWFDYQMEENYVKIYLKLMLFILLCFNLIFVRNVYANNHDQLDHDNNRNLESNINVKSPRKDGIWIQYFPLRTALRKNVVLSDIITPSSKWENWEGKEVNVHDTNAVN